MKKFDAHIHSNGAFSAEDLLEKLGRAGFYGGAVFSEAPREMAAFSSGVNGHQRLDALLASVASHRDRLFPLLWVHPDGDDLYNLIDEAVERGVAGFKVICLNFYAYEDKCLRMLEAIARRGKPVMFHSGILWDDTDSSKYNRPLNWECLCTIPGLRFSLAHCSWPWCDECIALYSKFLTNHAKHPELGNEMFFDMTPGTPVPYRKDLYTKLLLSGFDVYHNILWGTDCNTDDYAFEWTAKWDRIDNEIMDGLDVTEADRERIFRGNLERFLGISGEVYVARAPSNDGR